jgi:hypothetical protein
MEAGRMLWSSPNGLCRYDMLCLEGISLMLKIFKGQTESPNYRLVAPADGQIQTITVTEEVRWHTQEKNIMVLLTRPRPLE